MPVYNAGDFLMEAIESIRNQIYTDWELIVIDDCSQDNSQKILNEFTTKDKRIKVFRKRRKEFLSGCLNLALKKCRGKYIARMDADDISLPLRFQKQVELLEKNPNLVAVGGHEEIIDENGETIGVKKFPIEPTQCHNLMINYMTIQPPVLMARAKAMKNLKYDTQIAKNDDIDMHFQLLQRGDFSNVDEVIFQYRKRADSLTHSKAKRVFFMALRVRLRAIIKYGYRPNFIRLMLLLLETGLVLLLPPKLIVALFELLRVKSGSRRAFQPVGIAS